MKKLRHRIVRVCGIPQGGESVAAFTTCPEPVEVFAIPNPHSSIINLQSAIHNLLPHAHHLPLPRCIRVSPPPVE